MDEKKQLKDEELKNVAGGYDFKFYDYEFDENTKVKEIVNKYPWVVSLYPDLKKAANFGLTVNQACTISGVSYETLQATLTEYQNKYNEDGTPKTNAIYG